MIWRPRPGQRVKAHYRKGVTAPFHDHEAVGTVRLAGRTTQKSPSLHLNWGSFSTYTPSCGPLQLSISGPRSPPLAPVCGVYRRKLGARIQWRCDGWRDDE